MLGQGCLRALPGTAICFHLKWDLRWVFVNGLKWVQKWVLGVQTWGQNWLFAHFKPISGFPFLASLRGWKSFSKKGPEAVPTQHNPKLLKPSSVLVLSTPTGILYWRATLTFKE